MILPFFSKHLPPVLVILIPVIPWSIHSCVPISWASVGWKWSSGPGATVKYFVVVFYLSSGIQQDVLKVKTTWKARWLHQTQDAIHLKTALLQYYQVISIPEMLLFYSSVLQPWLWHKRSSGTVLWAVCEWCRSLCKVNRLYCTDAVVLDLLNVLVFSKQVLDPRT